MAKPWFEMPLPDLLAFVGVLLDTSGRAICPFHADTAPSMKYYPNTNKIWCFGCQKHYNHFDFLRNKGYSQEDCEDFFWSRGYQTSVKEPKYESTKVNWNILKRIIPNLSLEQLKRFWGLLEKAVAAEREEEFFNRLRKGADASRAKDTHSTGDTS